MAKNSIPITDFRLEGIEPRHDPAWHLAGEKGQRSYWNEAMRIGLVVKQRSILRGIGVNGEPVRDISPQTRKYRRSAMTPSGRGSPSAPPLVPGRELSRAVSYLRATVYNNGVSFRWRYDRRLGVYFGQILEYQAKQGRNIMGLSLLDWDSIVTHMDKYWEVNRVRLARLGAVRQGMHPIFTTPMAIGTHTPKSGVVKLIPTAKGGGLGIPQPQNLPPRVPLPINDPLAGLVTSAQEAERVIESAATGLFSGFRRGPGPMKLGGLLDTILKRRKAAKKRGVG